ncbi:MAG: glycosyltransferase [Clostridia bacterium]|nr:glycosyltransferase [Clostridia bacterium]
MDDVMKVLILTITTGQGHNQAAKTISEYLEKNEGVKATTLDAFEYINQGLKEIVSRGYLMSAKRLPKVYGKAYRMAEKRDSENGYIMRATSSIMAKKLIKFVEEYDADVIVCTHVFAAMLVTDIEKKFKRDIKTVGIVTDFTIHPYWEETDLDYYITANEFLINQAVKKGIDQEKVVPLGIPIDPKFATMCEKEQARKSLGIENKNTVLVMSGSMGYGKVARMVKRLDSSDMDFQIISVCGNNQKLKKQIDKMNGKHKIYNFGFTDKVDLMMDAADCIVTKPGGITSSEALAKELPMIIANPIPGQEDRNVEFLMNNGAAFKVSSTFPVDEAIYQMFTNKIRMRELKEIAGVLGKPDSTLKIVEFVLKVGGHTNEA